MVSANDDFSAGILTLQVGEMTESISVLARVSELQSESGERSFTLEGETIQNIANNGRSAFGFAPLVPGVVPLDGREKRLYRRRGRRHQVAASGPGLYLAGAKLF